MKTGTEDNIVYAGEIVITNARMLFKVFLTFFLIASFFSFLFSLFYIFIIQKFSITTFFFAIQKYLQAWVDTKLRLNTQFLLCANKSCTVMKYFAADIAMHSYANFVKQMLHKILFDALHVSIVVYPAFLLLFYYVLRHKIKKVKKSKVVKGTDITDPKTVAKELGKGDIRLTKNIYLPPELETQHLLVLGQTGAGKTVLLSQILQKLKEKEEKVIVYDYKGDYIQKFYDKKDILFNPFDARSARWTVFNEIENEIDANAISQSFIPSSSASTERYWRDAARYVFLGILLSILQEPKSERTNKKLYEVLTLQGADLVTFLKEHKQHTALSFLNTGTDSQAAGVLSTLHNFANIFKYFADKDGDFCLKKWIQEEKQGWLFVTNRQKAEHILKPALSLLIDLATQYILDLPDSRDRRIFLVVDELATLQKLPSLLQFLTNARSKGGCFFAGVQDAGILQQIYTRDVVRNTFLNNFSTLLTLRTGGETAQILSDFFGQNEQIKTLQNYNFGPDEIRDGINISRSFQTQKIVLQSEIASLKRWECYLRINKFITKDFIPKKFIESKDIPIFVNNKNDKNDTSYDTL